MAVKPPRGVSTATAYRAPGPPRGQAGCPTRSSGHGTRSVSGGSDWGGDITTGYGPTAEGTGAIGQESFARPPARNPDRPSRVRRTHRHTRRSLPPAAACPAVPVTMSAIGLSVCFSGCVVSAWSPFPAQTNGG